MDTAVISQPTASPLLQAVGHTPLIDLRLGRELNPFVRLFAKLECANPGGSYKDRPAARMLLQAYVEERFEDGRRLLECVSGNAGISFAMLGAALGIDVTLVVSGHASQEQIDRMAAHGAELILMDPLIEEQEAQAEVARLMEVFPTRYWRCDQLHNPANWQSHYYGTAAEALAQLDDAGMPPPDAVVVGVDTGGTLTGMGRRLREANPNIHIALVVPWGFAGLEGWRPLSRLNDANPALLNQSLVHERIPVTQEEARVVCRWLAHEGLFVGPTSGAYVRGALKLASSGKYGSILTLLPDTGERYTSTGMWHRNVVRGAFA